MLKNTESLRNWFSSSLDNNPTGDNSESWHILAMEILKNYSEKLGINTPRLVFGFDETNKNTPSRLLGKARTYEVAENTYDKDGKLVETRVKPITVFLTRKFTVMFERDSDKAEKVLRFVIAHELAHIYYKHKCNSALSEKEADDLASKITGINALEMGYAYFTLIPHRNREKQERILEYYKHRLEKLADKRKM